MQPVFHARIAAERGDGTGYTIDDVADGIVAKLVRRHPHVFGDVTVSGADEVKRNWDEIKRPGLLTLSRVPGWLWRADLLFPAYCSHPLRPVCKKILAR